MAKKSTKTEVTVKTETTESTEQPKRWYRTRTDPKEIRRLKRYMERYGPEEWKRLNQQVGTLEQQVRGYEEGTAKLNEALTQTQQERDSYKTQAEELARIREENKQLKEEKGAYDKIIDEVIKLFEEYDAAFGESTTYFGKVIKDTIEKKDEVLRILRDP